MKLPTLGLEEREFDSLPPALRRKVSDSNESISSDMQRLDDSKGLIEQPRRNAYR